MSNFHLTAELNSIRVENGHMLHARIIQADGDHVHSEFDLNRCIGNQDERKSADEAADFSETARDIRFNIEGENQPILRASLEQVNGEWHDRDINLTERIMNRDGQLVFEP
ncbi:hypothetical protein VSDG_05173 [Cytospora chrysosperma]|uniref:Cyanovirin-N domain-containing protein n=1 Tax=Cytospora chrysosperma TaxID=252740 RepID=A0A423VXL3_CYTCH|nr:hypothetical protein VSDG_05173 [Valsa sordida]